MTSISKNLIYWAVHKGEEYNILIFLSLTTYPSHPELFCEPFQQKASGAFYQQHIISNLQFQNLQDTVPKTETQHVPIPSKNVLINEPSACLYKAKNLTDCNQRNLRTPDNTEAISA